MSALFKAIFQKKNFTLFRGSTNQGSTNQGITVRPKIKNYLK